MYNHNDQVKRKKMVKACSTYGGEEECILDFCGKAGRKEMSREDIDMGAKVILKWVFEK
jgi:hypothetical protein